MFRRGAGAGRTRLSARAVPARGDGSRIHVAQRGDTLRSSAREFADRLQDLVTRNPLAEGGHWRDTGQALAGWA